MVSPLIVRRDIVLAGPVNAIRSGHRLMEVLSAPRDDFAILGDGVSMIWFRT